MKWWRNKVEAFVWAMIVLIGLGLALSMKDYYNGIFPVPKSSLPMTKGRLTFVIIVNAIIVIWGLAVVPF